MQLLKFKRVYTVIIITLGIGTLIILSRILSSDRESLISFLLQHLQRPYLSGILTDRILTPRKFALIRHLSYAGIAVIVGLVVLLLLYRERMITLFQRPAQSVSAALRSLIFVFRKSTKAENIIFTAILSMIFIRGLYYIIVTDLQYDEMWCYNYYTSRPFYLNFFSYANYPLYELITHVFKWLPFPMKINIRLPSLLAGICSCIVIYGCTKQISRHFLTALACSILFATIPLTTNYMLCAKGVTIELFFAITSFFCTLYFLKAGASKRYLYLFAASNIFGMYAMPTHIYFWMIQFVLASLYILLYKKHLWKNFLLANTFILLGSIFCYLPMIMGSGISFVTDAALGGTAINYPWTDIISFLKDVSLDQTGNSYGLTIAVACLVIVLAARREFKKEYFFLLALEVVLLILPAPIHAWQHIYIPERSIAFMVLIIPVSVFMVFSLLRGTVRPFLLPVSFTILLLVSVTVSHFHSFRFWSAAYDRNAIGISATLMGHRVTNCYDNAPGSHFFYYYPALEYYYSRKHQRIDLQTADRRSLRYQLFSPSEDYDCIVDSAGSITSVERTGYETVFVSTEEGFAIKLRKSR